MQLIRDRYSCRQYKDMAIDRADLDRVLEAARMAPSACNRQPWTFHVVQDPELRARMLAKSRPGFMHAPAVIVAVGHHGQAWHRPADQKDHTDVDVSIAVEHICLAATALGLATCWVCSFDTQAVCDVLSLGTDDEPVALIPIGYPDDCPIEKKRKPLSEMSTYA